MKYVFTFFSYYILFFVGPLTYNQTAVAQQRNLPKPADSLRLPYPVTDTRSTPFFYNKGFDLATPPNVKRTVEYDAKTNRYIIKETIGGKLFRAPQYLTFKEYQDLELKRLNQQYFKESTTASDQASRDGIIPQVRINSRTFERIFGGNVIDIQPRGTADLTFAGRINRNENPLFNERLRRQGNFDFDQRIQMNVTGNIGEKLKIITNYNTEAQFDFENQIKLEYTGKPDEIIKKVEAGMVSFPLNTTLITGSQALFGIKTQLQFGRLGVTSLFSQQKSQSKEIVITNGSQQNEFSITADNYEANKHFFLSQYFRNNYNRSLANLPVVTSNINITKIEVWVTNRSNSTTDSRDVLGFLDLAENQPFNTALFSGAGGSGFPAAFSDPGFPDRSNNLLEVIPAGARFTNNNDINAFFQSTGAQDNFIKLTYARKLTDREFTINPFLGYISLNAALNADEVLTVAYRYTVNGREFQVGEFSTDIAVDAANPRVLYTKLLKNELLKTNLPIWDLMMKNIYSLGAYQVSAKDFRLNVFRVDEQSGVERPVVTEGANTNGRLWLQVLGLDNLNQQNDRRPDGFFDFLPNQTIDPLNGRIIFPVIEPFGSDLARQFNPGEIDLIQRYSFQPLYDSTKALASQFFPNLNRYIIKGTYQSEVSSEFQLNAINVPEGSVVVTAGTLKLQEGADFTVDYNIGRVRILNQALLNSGQPIRIRLESNELFGVQQRSLFGTRLDYKVNNKLALGGTVMNLKETPLTPKVNFGEESISNTMWGLDVNYNSPSRLLTRLVDKIPFISTKEPSAVNFSAEYANLIPGHPKALNFAGSENGASYIDDFEGSRSLIDIKSALPWQISPTPQFFTEALRDNDLSYGFNRAKLAFYNIDQLFYSNNTFTPDNIKGNRNALSNHYVREVTEPEVFPFKQSATGTLVRIPTLDLAYYPTIRGPYNFSTTGINNDGTLSNPRSRWGGMFRKLDNNDFEALNIEFVEFWVLDPFIYNRNAQGGDLYLNLGSISEDILRDGRKSLENGLPVDQNLADVDETTWGRVPKLQPVIQAFDNDPNSRTIQDVGLDGISNADEQAKFQQFLQQVTPQLNAEAAAQLSNDPSSDDFTYYRGPLLDQTNAGILKRYERFNGTEGNSKTNQQSQDQLGIDNSASTALPDGEDINRDNNSSRADEYYQYRVSIRPQDLVVGQNFIADKVTSAVRLANGTREDVSWYQFKVPLAEFQDRIGNIQDFKAIRFIRMFMTDFADTTILRFARLQLVRGEWRRFNAENNPAKAITDPALNNPGLDNSTLDVTTVNIEENGTRTPIPYVIPPGIDRERDFSNFRGDTRQNEQSLALNVRNLRDGYSRAAYRTTFNDFRSFRRVEMFIHAEGDILRDNDINAFVRFGTDYQDNYYEYEIPMKITLPGTRDPNTIWPDQNKLSIEFRLFQQAKISRNNARLNGQPWPVNLPFTYSDGRNRVTIKGQPDLSKVRTILLGVRNPLQNNALPGNDDGLDKTAQVWFNELRLTDFDERGGWAATARLNAKLADFAEVSVSASKSTVGFGSIDKRVSERSRTDDEFLDVSSNVELGKFFPEKTGIKIPMFVSYSTQVGTPQFDPRSPDLLLKEVLSSLNAAERDSVKRITENLTTRKSINFTNVRKIRTNTQAKPKLWDIENLSLSYAFSEYNHRDYINENTIQKNYRGALAYNYSTQPKFIAPFNKAFKSENWAFLKDINFNLLPSLLNFRIEVDRLYSENSLRNNDPNNFLPINVAFNKNFLINRLYGLSWDLTKSLKLDFNATNLSVVDEPEGRIVGLKRDTITENLRRLGRTTDYGHNISFNYTLPISKIPYLNFINVVARYQTQFNWRTEPLITLRDPNIDFGNTIQNNRTVQLNPTLNFVTLYNKLGFYRAIGDAVNDSTGLSFGQSLVNALFSIKNVSGSYTRNDGTFLPGYLPKTDAFGQDFGLNAPGFGFLLGSQADLRERAIQNGWITQDTLQNQLYINTLNEKLNLRGTLEPFRDLRIELTAFKNSSKNFSSNFKFSPDNNSFESFSPITGGDYSVSFLSLKTAFKSEDKTTNASAIFQNFLSNRQVISRRLGAGNNNSNGVADGFADGYGKDNQDVLVTSFLAAYQGKDANSVTLNKFPKIPVPNWRITYNGLSKINFINNLFTAIDVSHGYNSTYNVNSFNSLIRYSESNGNVNVRDATGNFLPFYQFAQVTIFEQFVPLLGLDMRLKNNMTANVEYRQSRALSLSLSNSQIAQQKDAGFIFGFGYRTTNFRFPFGLFKSFKLNNDLNFKMDMAIRDTKTVIYRADVDSPEVSAGSNNISVRPSIDYVLNQRFNIRLFYDSNITKPYTSQTFTTAFSNFGVNLRFTLQ